VSVKGTIRAASFLLVLFIAVVVGGAFLNALFVRIEPMLLYGLSPDMVDGYFTVREWLAFIWQWSVRLLVLVAEFLIVTAGIGWAGNIFKERETYA